MTTIHERVAAARRRLREAGIAPDEADLDARLLAEHVLGWDTARFFSAADESEPPGFASGYETLVARRAAREPISYITGRHEFWNLSFEVSPAVLIPRPETELVVEVGLELLKGPGPRGVHSWAIADVCTGSGCVAVALAHECRSAFVIATDVSDAALDVARRNAARHRADARIRFTNADLLAGIVGAFDLIVSNPPYVPERERAALEPEVREHEPAAALFGGADGLAVIRRLIAEAPPHLEPGGALVFEIGAGQADEVGQLISRTPGLTMVGLRPDLQGIPRTAIARRT